MPVTFECAGNGRALLQPRPLSQPWLTEAVGTAEWAGTPLKPLLDEAGVRRAGGRGAVHGARPRRRGRRRPGLRALAAARRRRARAARLRDERRAAAAAARVPAAAGRAGLVRDDERQVARPHHPARGALRRLPELRRLPHVRRGRRARRAPHAHAAALADGPARGARLHDPQALPGARPGDAARSRLVGFGAVERVEVSTDGGESFDEAELDEPVGAGRLARLALQLGRPAGRVRALLARDRRRRQRAAAGAALEPQGLREQRRRPHRRSRSLLRLPAPCASSPASSPPAASTSATTSAPSAATSRARTAPTRRSTASSTCTPRASPTTPARCPATCSTRPRC